MFNQIQLPKETQNAKITFKRFFTSVQVFMPLKNTASIEASVAYFTFVPKIKLIRRYITLLQTKRFLKSFKNSA